MGSVGAEGPLCVEPGNHSGFILNTRVETCTRFAEKVCLISSKAAKCKF